MARRSNKRKLEKTCGDSVPCQIAHISGYDTVSPSMYLVVGHQISPPAYSVYKVTPFADGGGGGGGSAKRIKRCKSIASLYGKHSMAFAPVRSKHGPWIVGVGGDNAEEDYGAETIVFDTKTQEVITGPKPLSTKLCPVLLTFGNRIYALSQGPRVKGTLDFVPWFEVLDISQAQVVDGRLVNCKWKEIPRPPFFPWELTPRQYIIPPEITVESYVAVGSCILVSVTGQTGTHMFDTETEQWVKLDDKDLPFIRGAIPHGPLLFLGLSRRSKEITAYKITVTTGCPSLSIDEFPMATDCEIEEELVSSSRFVSLGDHSFCSFNCRTINRMPEPQHMGELVSMRAYTIENPLSHDRLKYAHTLLVSNQWKQVYSVRDSFRGLCPSLEAVIYL